MPDAETDEHRLLSELVVPVQEKITSGRDASLPYVGLEQIPSRGSYLNNWLLAGASISTNSVFRAGDTLFGKLRPNLRKCVTASFEGYCSTDILVLRARPSVDPRFATRVFQSEFVGRAAEQTAIGTKMPRTSWEALERLPVFCPESKEQKLVADILDDFDRAIRQAEIAVQKLKQVKQGLLHDLLTRGMDSKGELRGHFHERPDLYKKSPLGWIPKSWSTRSLGDAAMTLIDGPFGSKLKTEHYTTEGIRVVRLQNIQRGAYDDSERAFISAKYAASLDRNRVEPGDVLIASLGDDNYPVGRACCYPVDFPYAINKADCFRFRGKRDVINAFIMLFMNGARARVQVRRYEQGVTMKRVNLSNLRQILVSLPEKPEQDAIVERVESLDRKIQLSLAELNKSRMQKSGLMDDLLTGRVRVTSLLEN